LLSLAFSIGEQMHRPEALIRLALTYMRANCDDVNEAFADVAAQDQGEEYPPPIEFEGQRQPPVAEEEIQELLDDLEKPHYLIYCMPVGALKNTVYTSMDRCWDDCGDEEFPVSVFGIPREETVPEPEGGHDPS
jgi:hypothetical protein